MNNRYVQLQKGMETAFVDSSVSSNLAYKLEFVSNNYKEGRKVLSDDCKIGGVIAFDK